LLRADARTRAGEVYKFDISIKRRAGKRFSVSHPACETLKHPNEAQKTPGVRSAPGFDDSYDSYDSVGSVRFVRMHPLTITDAFIFMT